MSVQVRLFAALRETAGTTTTTVDADTVGDALEVLSSRYGPGFARWVDVATALVDGHPADRAARLAPGAELVLLPPFSGG